MNFSLITESLTKSYPQLIDMTSDIYVIYSTLLIIQERYIEAIVVLDKAARILTFYKGLSNKDSRITNALNKM